MSENQNNNPWLDAAVALQYLQQKFAGMEFPVPRFAICGMQSAGKTRLLSVFAGRKIGGAEKAATGTRCPVIYRFQMTEGPEKFQIGKDMHRMQDINPCDIDDFITKHMDQLGEEEKVGKTGFSNHPIHVDLLGKKCLNAVIVDLPGVKPICAEFEHMNTVIMSMIRKQVTELKAIPLVMSGFNSNMDMHFVKADLETVLKSCVQENASYGTIAKRAILIVSRLDMARQALISNSEKLEEFQLMAQEVGFDRRNMIFLTLVPEALDGKSAPICQKDTSYEDFEDYFQNTFVKMEEAYYPELINQLDPENERKFRISALKQTIEGTLEADMRKGLHAALEKMRQEASKLANDIGTALEPPVKDESLRIHAEAYVNLINDVLDAANNCNASAMELAISAFAKRFPTRLNRVDTRFCKELLTKMSRNFDTELEAVMEAMPDVSSELYALQDPKFVKLLEETAPSSDHVLVATRNLKLCGSGSIRRLLSLFGFSVVTRPMQANFTLNEIINMAGMNGDIRGPFPVSKVLLKMVKQFAPGSQAAQSIIYWAFWLYSSQAAAVIEALSEQSYLLEEYPEMQAWLNKIFIQKIENWAQAKAAKAVVKIEELMRLRFGVLKLDELFSVIRLLGCSNMTLAIFPNDDKTTTAAEQHDHWKKVYRTIERAAEKDKTSRQAKQQIGAVTDLLKAVVDQPAEATRNAFKYLSKSLPNCHHDFASFEGIHIKDISYADVKHHISNLTETSKMLAIFQSGQAFFDLVAIVETLVIEEANQMHETMKVEMASVIESLFRDAKFNLLMRHLDRGIEEDRKNFLKCEELNERVNFFLEAAARLNQCCDQIGIRKLETENLKVLAPKIKAIVQKMTDDGLSVEIDDSLGDLEQRFSKEIHLLEMSGVASDEHDIVVARLTKKISELDASKKLVSIQAEKTAKALEEKVASQQQRISELEKALQPPKPEAEDRKARLLIARQKPKRP